MDTEFSSGVPPESGIVRATTAARWRATGSVPCMDDLPCDDRVQDVEIRQIVRVDPEKVTVDHAEVGNFANLDGALPVFGEVLPSSVDGVRTQRGFEIDPLIR